MVPFPFVAGLSSNGIATANAKSGASQYVILWVGDALHSRPGKEQSVDFGGGVDVVRAEDVVIRPDVLRPARPLPHQKCESGVNGLLA